MRAQRIEMGGETGERKVRLWVLWARLSPSWWSLAALQYDVALGCPSSMMYVPAALGALGNNMGWG